MEPENLARLLSRSAQGGSVSCCDRHQLLAISSLPCMDRAEAIKANEKTREAAAILFGPAEVEAVNQLSGIPGWFAKLVVLRSANA